MGTNITQPQLWPAEPTADADVNERMAWYAAVARWAPSKHNTQPWRFVVRDGSLEFWSDSQRTLPDTDPQHREMVISCGAAVYFAAVAARALGRGTYVEVLTEGGTELLARMVETGGRRPSEEGRALLEAIPFRHTDRGPLDGAALDPTVAFTLQAAAAAEGASLRLVSTEGDRATLGGLIERADRLLVQRGGVDRELERWLRDAGDTRQDGVPSQNTRGAAASYRAPFVQRDFSQPGSHPEQDRTGPDQPLVGVLCTQADRPSDWLAAGQALGAVLLRAALAGANASYLNQPVEEPLLREQLRQDLLLPGLPQLVLRIGIGGDVAPTPRRDPDAVTFRT